MTKCTRLIVGLTMVLVACVAAAESGRSQQPAGKKEQAIVGVWTQYVESADKPGNWKEFGSFRVLFKDDKLLMTIEDQSKAPDPSFKSQGLFNVKADGERWSFSSDWGNNIIALFKLNRVNDEVYEGYSHLNDVKRDHNIWVRTKKKRQATPSQPLHLTAARILAFQRSLPPPSDRVELMGRHPSSVTGPAPTARHRPGRYTL